MFVPINVKAKNVQSFVTLDYDFQAGKAIMVQGNNLTNRGQATNGSGKSTLFEVIYYCLLGGTSSGKRDMKLIRHGEPSCSMELTLRNNLYRCELTVRRTVYRSKNSTLEIYENGVLMKDKYATVNDGNRYLLEFIGISPDDIKNYYLINRDRFVSFFSSPDSKKRELIGRFSGAHKLAKSDQVINQEIEKIERELKSLRDERLQVSTRKTVYEEQRQDLMSLDLEKQKGERLESLRQEKERVQAEIRECEKFEEHSKSWTAQVQVERVQAERVVERLNKACRKLRSISYDDEVAKIRLEVSGKEEDIQKCKGRVKELDAEGQELYSSSYDLDLLLRGKIECPKCHHVYNPSFEMPVDEAKELLEEVEEAIREVEGKKKKVNDTIKEIEKEIESIESGMDVWKRKERKKSALVCKHSEELNRALFSLDRIRTKEAKVQEDLARNSVRAVELREKVKAIEAQAENAEKMTGDPGIDQKVGDLGKKIEECQCKLDELQSRVDVKEEELRKKKAWVVNFKNFYVYLTNRSLETIQGYSNMFLEKINTDLQLKLEGFKTLSDGSVKESINAVIYRDGKEEDDYRCYSGGEKGRLIFSTILTFQNLINQSSPSGGLDLIMVDEILDAVDSEGMVTFIEALQSLHLTILLISQVQVDKRTENVLIVEKENDESRLVKF